MKENPHPLQEKFKYVPKEVKEEILLLNKVYKRHPYNPNNLLSFSDLALSPLNDALNHKFESNRLLFIEGASGVGKSTTTNILNDLYISSGVRTEVIREEQ